MSLWMFQTLYYAQLHSMCLDIKNIRASKIIKSENLFRLSCPKLC